MKKTLIVMLAVLVLFFTSSAAMAQPRYHGGHPGHDNGVVTGLVILGVVVLVGVVVAVVNGIVRAASRPDPAQQPIPAQQPAYAQQTAPADHIHIGECFPDGKYFPDDVGVFNEYGQEVGYIPAETTFRPGTCLQ